jgi:hypothetical protein
MNVIWKRPDGFHGASPSDYEVIELQQDAKKLWLHKADRENYPFRVSGDWQEEEATRRLNGLVNLLPCPQTTWNAHLTHTFHNTEHETWEKFVMHTVNWIKKLQLHLKGDVWEVAIMADALDEVVSHLEQARVVPREGGDK